MSEHETPVDPPCLPENVPYMRVLGQLTLQLSALNQNLAGLVHEIRHARTPVAENGLVEKLRSVFRTLRGIAEAGEEAFQK